MCTKLFYKILGCLLIFCLLSSNKVISQINYCCSECSGKEIVPNELYERPNRFMYPTPNFCEWEEADSANLNESYFLFKFNGAKPQYGSGEEIGRLGFKGMMKFMKFNLYTPAWQLYIIDPSHLKWNLLHDYLLKMPFEWGKTEDYFNSLANDLKTARRFAFAIKYKRVNNEITHDEFDVLISILTQDNILKRYKNGVFIDQRNGDYYYSLDNESVFLF